MEIISKSPSLYIAGDSSSISHSNERIKNSCCIDSIRSLGHHQEQIVNNKTWKLQCWQPAHCRIKYSDQQGHLRIELLPDDNKPEGRTFNLFNRLFPTVSVRTLLLPYERDTISYTFLPFDIKQSSMFFVTSLLSGCEVFVARPNNSNCNLVVLHANKYNQIQIDGTDYHYRQTIAALERLNGMNNLCQYIISKRWAPSDHESFIEERYNYSSQTHYYNIKKWNFLFAFNYGNNAGWQFCLKEFPPSNSLRCYFV